MKGSRIPAGRLDRRVTVLRAAPAAHDGYEPVPGALQVLGSRLASIKPAWRREGVQAGGMEAAAELSAWLRVDNLTRTIRATDKVVLDGRLFELTAAPIEIGRGYAIELLLVGNADGASIDVGQLDPVP